MKKIHILLLTTFFCLSFNLGAQTKEETERADKIISSGDINTQDASKEDNINFLLNYLDTLIKNGNKTASIVVKNFLRNVSSAGDMTAEQKELYRELSRKAESIIILVGVIMVQPTSSPKEYMFKSTAAEFAKIPKFEMENMSTEQVAEKAMEKMVDHINTSWENKKSIREMLEPTTLKFLIGENGLVYYLRAKISKMKYCEARYANIIGLYSLLELAKATTYEAKIQSGSVTLFDKFREEFNVLVEIEKGMSSEFKELFESLKTSEGKFDVKKGLEEFKARGIVGI